ncbi:MAG: adenylyltransferase/cytidyltransferase family protein [Candidatus Gracilibacteria bacterium]|jgi:FAD synthetase|nr:adenylyltransferase/cytidyltransferase family protein [Candidatus Gracilibacteria bacterium]
MTDKNSSTSKPSKEKTVMIFGTFDLLHAGHENLVRQARELGDKVIAIIARDKTVKNIKGHLPDADENTRLKNLKNTGWVDEIYLGDIKDKTKFIKQIKPHIIALGYDQFAFTYNLERLIIENRLNTRIVRLTPYRPEIYKSSLLKKQMKNENSEKPQRENQLNSITLEKTI